MDLIESIKFAETMVANGDYSKAQKFLGSLCEKYPGNKRILNDLGVLYFHLKEWDLSKRFFNLALKYDPKYIDALENKKQLEFEIAKTQSNSNPPSLKISNTKLIIITTQNIYPWDSISNFFPQFDSVEEIKTPDINKLAGILNSNSNIVCYNAGNYPIQISNIKSNCKITLILRDADIFNDAFISSLNWNNIHKLIFLSKYTFDLAHKFHKEKISIVPEITLFPFFFSSNHTISSIRKPGKTVLIPDFLSELTAVDILLQSIKLVIEKDSNFLFLASTDAGNFRFTSYFMHLASKLKLLGNIKLFNRNDLEVISNKNIGLTATFKISADNNNIVPYLITKGLIPLIYNCPGANEFYPQNCLFSSPEEFTLLLLNKYHNDLNIPEFSHRFVAPKGIYIKLT